eukprot:4539513-Alexandrium_andersonii.AAC.1
MSQPGFPVGPALLSGARSGNQARWAGDGLGVFGRVRVCAALRSEAGPEGPRGATRSDVVLHDQEDREGHEGGPDARHREGDVRRPQARPPILQVHGEPREGRGQPCVRHVRECRGDVRGPPGDALLGTLRPEFRNAGLEGTEAQVRSAGLRRQ